MVPRDVMMRDVEQPGPERPHLLLCPDRREGAAGPDVAPDKPCHRNARSAHRAGTPNSELFGL